MIRLKHLYIKGFKDPNREVNIRFSDSPITIIYGENGCGKTTLLKVIQAIFKNDIAFLKSQNVREIRLDYQVGREDYEQIHIITNENIDKILLNNDLAHENSILFGVNRAIVESHLADFEFINKELTHIKDTQKILSPNSYQILEKLIKRTNTNLTNTNDDFLLQSNHIIIDNLTISSIDKSLREAYNKGQTALLKGINNAFFSTIDNAINIGNNKELPINFWERYNTKKNLLLSFASNLETSSTQKKLIAFLSSDRNNFEDSNAIFKALIINMLETVEKDEKENIELKAIQTLIEQFNTFIINGKKLYVSPIETYIEVASNGRHELADLSSGELHLLSFLTLFLILGRGRNFYLIDEPEISMSMKWQEKLLPLLHELSPESQIIVATHSPEIADGHEEYLVELV